MQGRLGEPNIIMELPEWLTNEEDEDPDAGKGKGGGQQRLGLVPERQMYLKVLRGEQDGTNKIP